MMQIYNKYTAKTQGLVRLFLIVRSLNLFHRNAMAVSPMLLWGNELNFDEERAEQAGNFRDHFLQFLLLCF
jgi:hypothetical protein